MPFNGLLTSPGAPGKSSLLQAALSKLIDLACIDGLVKQSLSDFRDALPTRFSSTKATSEESAILFCEAVNKHKAFGEKRKATVTEWVTTRTIKEGNKKLFDEFFVNHFMQRYQNTIATYEPQAQEWLSQTVGPQFKKAFEDIIAAMNFDRKVQVFALLESTGDTMLKDCLDKLVQKWTLIAGVVQPIIFFIMCGRYGTSGVFGDSDQQYFQAFEEKLRTLQNTLYNFNAEKAAQNPEYIRQHLRSTLEKSLPKLLK